MYISTSLSLAVILSLQVVGISSAPAPVNGSNFSSVPAPVNGSNLSSAPAPVNGSYSAFSTANKQVDVQTITKNIDCVLFDTPMSCDTFCFATFCMGLPSTLSHETDKKQQDKNRVASGASLTPFNNKGISKYGTTRRSNDATIADEYPLASSLEGGLGINGQGRAIIQGATKADQQGQSNWAKKLWTKPDIPQAAKVEINLTNWDPNLSSYCEAKKNNDQSACHNPTSFFYRREDTNNGPNGAASFQHIGI